MKRLRFLTVVFFPVALISGSWALCQEDAPGRHFRLRFNEAGITSLKRMNDTHDTEYIAEDQVLGHISIRYRMLKAGWQEFSTRTVSNERRRVRSSPDEDAPRHLVGYNESGWDDYFADLEVLEGFRVEGDALYWTLHFRNLTHKPLELGDVILPLPFNSEARWDKTVMYTRRVTPHRWISGHGSFLFWMRPNSEGPYLVMTPVQECPLFESARNERNFKPAQLEFSQRNSVYIHSAAQGEEDRARGGNWRQPQTGAVLTPKYSPGDELTYMFKFRWADDYDGIRDILCQEGLLDIHVVPGMTVPRDLEAQVSIRTKRRIASIEPEYPQQTEIEPLGEKSPNTTVYKIRFSRLGENKLTIHFGRNQYTILEFFVTQELETLIKKRAGFLVKNQQHRDPDKWYNGLFSEWDMRHRVLRGPDDADGLRRYVLSCDDPGLCKAPYVAAKNVHYPEAVEIEAVEYYIRHFVWGKLQCTDQEEYPYGVYGIPDWKVNRESGPNDREGWTGHVWRVFDYPHMINLYWCMYQVAKFYPELTSYLDADGYLERAYGTALAYFTLPLQTADWSACDLGNFDELVIRDVIRELDDKKWAVRANRLRAVWEKKVEHFINDGPNLFHSEFPFDPTGFESYQAFAGYACEELKNPTKTLDVTAAAAEKFMEEEIAANIATRGWMETSYYQLGGERSLRYMSQMGGWAILDYALYYAESPVDYLRLGYASFLSSWALMNAGTPDSDYGYWYSGKENDGAAGSAFVIAPYGRTWLGKEQPRGAWIYSAEIDLGFGGGLRTAATVVSDDPIFGLIAYGGRLTESEDALQVIPRDGLRKRFHVIRGDRRFHMRLDRDGFKKDTPLTLDKSLNKIRFALENRSGGAHQARLSIAGLAPGEYSISIDRNPIGSLRIEDAAWKSITLPVGMNDSYEVEIIRSQGSR